MPSRKGFIAVDWGSTNRRVFAIAPDGRLEERLRDNVGALAVARGGFGALIAELRARLGERPLLLAGMVGSNRGWVEVPYLACPVDIDALAAGVKWLGDGSIAIVPGASYVAGDAADVMRGEEVQILGAVASGLVPRDALICHPGTHAKWVRVREARMEAFRTVMTGEMFNLLRHHSILSDLLGRAAHGGGAFAAGVQHALERDDLLAELFAIRARVLLGKRPSDSASSFASGLLVGSDVKIGLSFAGAGAEVVLIGDAHLTELYGSALSIAGRASRRIDGEEAFLHGARLVAEQIL